MGTKRHLAHHVQRLAADCSPGPLLDVFSGMCAIGRSVAASRHVWSNDLQIFAHEVATAHFCATRARVDVRRLLQLVKPHFDKAMSECRIAFYSELSNEKLYLSSLNIDAAVQGFDDSIRRAQNVTSRHTALPIYSMILTRYGGTYFGYEQAAEADSVRSALDSLHATSQIDDDTYRFALIGLCGVLSKVSTTTGHFAQPLKPKFRSGLKFRSQRARSVLSEWASILPSLRALGSQSWRSKNRAFRGDAIDLLNDLRGEKNRPTIVYADPPYTKDQYSRYYHILETLILYDFPDCEGTGLYRPDRATSSFSQASRVEEALDELFESISRLSASLILSYPAEGLLPNSTAIIPRMIKNHFGRNPDIVELEYVHSTMGASKGKDKHSVREILYRVAV
jgi:adenine-specific DNA-methyltransferase